MKPIVFALVAAAIWAAAPIAAAQDQSLGGYKSMKIDYIGELTGGFDGRFETMSGGVEITLTAEDPNLKPLPIKARTMTFEYGEGSGTPARIVMQGGVSVNHPTAAVMSEKAVWDFESGEMTFSGDVVMNNDRMQDVRCEQLVLNFNTNRYRMTNVKAQGITLPGDAAAAGGAAAGGGDPSLLDSGDVKDWAGLVDTFKKQAAAEGASPGRQIAALLDAETRGILKSASTETIVGNKGAFLKQLNKVLQSPNLYKADAWAGTALSDEAKSLIDKKDRTAAETIRLNRLLICAAYPDFIAAP